MKLSGPAYVTESLAEGRLFRGPRSELFLNLLHPHGPVRASRERTQRLQGQSRLRSHPRYISGTNHGVIRAGIDALAQGTDCTLERRLGISMFIRSRMKQVLHTRDILELSLGG